MFYPATKPPRFCTCCGQRLVIVTSPVKHSGYDPMIGDRIMSDPTRTLECPAYSEAWMKAITVRYHGNNRWCIDVGDQHNGSLVGMWLPSHRIVAVGSDASLHEMRIDCE